MGKLEDFTGAHVHVFKIEGHDDLLVTEKGESHEQARVEAEHNAVGSDHDHRLVVPGLGELTTYRDEIVVNKSKDFGGVHSHLVKLPDGTSVRSLTSKEIEKYYKDDELEKPIAKGCDSFLGPVEDSVFANVESHFRKHGTLPTMPNTIWEVTDMAKGGAYCALQGMDSPQLMKNPNNISLKKGSRVEVDHSGTIQRRTIYKTHTVEKALDISTKVEETLKKYRSVPFTGSKSAPVVFVAASPTPLELARREPLVGPDGEIFLKTYIEPLGLTKSQVGLGFVSPIHTQDIEPWKEHLFDQLATFGEIKIIALGKAAKRVLGDLADHCVPHPAGLRRYGDRGEVARKMKTVRKQLDAARDLVQNKSSLPIDTQALADTNSEPETAPLAVFKSSEEKQIVYGVVLDPYQVDLQNDWIPPAEVENTSHNFAMYSLVIGLNHTSKADAQVAESWCELYPSKEDHRAAMQNKPHKIYRRKYGSDLIHSGAWCVAVKLSDELWAQHKAGELDAFSIGGFSNKTEMSSEVMPDVEIIDVEPRI